MDATLKGIPLTRNDVQEVFEEILNIDLCDGVTFKIISIKDIRLEDEYGGFRLNILSQFGNNKTYIAVELTTGDVITPREMKYNYNSIFEDKKIPLLTYTLETVLAEKFQSVITRGVFNTRQKDFYDIYVLMNFKKNANCLSVQAVRLENEIYRELGNPKSNSKRLLEIIKQCAQEKYKACHANGDSEETECLIAELKKLQPMEHFQSQILRKFICKILITPAGAVTIQLKNGAII